MPSSLALEDQSKAAILIARANLLYVWNTKFVRWDGGADVAKRYDLYTTYTDHTRDVVADGRIISVSGDFLINGDVNWRSLDDNLTAYLPNSIFPDKTVKRLFNLTATLELDEIYLSSFVSQHAAIAELDVEINTTADLDVKEVFKIEFNVGDILTSAVAIGTSRLTTNALALRAVACYTGFFIKKQLENSVVSVTISYSVNSDPKKNSQYDILNLIFGVRLSSVTVSAELTTQPTYACHFGCPSRSVPYHFSLPEKTSPVRRLYPSLDAIR